QFRVQVQALARLNRYFFLAFAWHKSGSLAVSLCLTHKRLDRLGSGLDIGPHCPNGSTQKCVMSLIRQDSQSLSRPEISPNSKHADAPPTVTDYSPDPDRLNWPPINTTQADA
ncbi:hypothetical protein, partial [Burkholderia diffusa]|uniref:hypothetical protein n=1 Tax=Burkholderia diffusa TaxID=488732 RepID=UPI001BA44B70